MRSHYCGDVNASNVDQEVEVCGWVNKRRDHGGVIFIDLRDRNGLIQCVFDPDDAEMFAVAEQVRNEFVLRIKGLVRLRPEGTTNDELSTGEIELLGRELEILNRADTPPIQIDDDDTQKYQADGMQFDQSMPCVERIVKQYVVDDVTHEKRLDHFQRGGRK